MRAVGQLWKSVHRIFFARSWCGVATLAHSLNMNWIRFVMICEIKCSTFFPSKNMKHHGGEILKSFTVEVKVVDQKLPEKLADLAPKWTVNDSVVTVFFSRKETGSISVSLIRAPHNVRCFFPVDRLLHKIHTRMGLAKKAIFMPKFGLHACKGTV